MSPGKRARSSPVNARHGRSTKPAPRAVKTFDDGTKCSAGSSTSNPTTAESGREQGSGVGFAGQAAPRSSAAQAVRGAKACSVVAAPMRVRRLAKENTACRVQQRSPRGGSPCLKPPPAIPPPADPTRRKSRQQKGTGMPPRAQPPAVVAKEGGRPGFFFFFFFRQAMSAVQPSCLIAAHPRCQVRGR